MKRSIQIQFLILGLALVITAAGCKTRPKDITRIPGGSGQPGYPGADGQIEPIPVDGGIGIGGGGVSGNPIDSEMQDYPTGDPGDIANFSADRNTLSAYTVFFGFDSSTIGPSEGGKIESVAAYLRNNPTHVVRVEGHCDERGTEQYNLALGDRRASSVREYMINLGISPDRVVPTSMGEEMPVCDIASEACYAQNRRGEFVVLRP